MLLWHMKWEVCGKVSATKREEGERKVGMSSSSSTLTSTRHVPPQRLQGSPFLKRTAT